MNWLLTGIGEAYINTDSNKGPVAGDSRGGISREDLALIRTLKLCGEEYRKRVFITVSVRAQNVVSEKRLETKKKLVAQEDMEALSIASIK